jgi:hypothetical protein
LLGVVATLSSQCDTTHENHIALFGREDTETGAKASLADRIPAGYEI